jgi:MFS family permease
MAIVTSVFPASERGKALGINVAAVYLGLAAGPVVGGLLTEHFGWRSIFWLTAPLLLMGAAFTVLRLKGEWAEARGQKFDFAGSAVYAVALVSLMLGFTMLPGRPGLALCAAGALAFIALLVIETRIHAPVLDIRLFRGNPVFAMSNVAALINYAATFGITFLVSLYLQYCRGLTPEQAGLLMMAEPVPMALFSPLAGRLSDRMEPRVVASAGMALCVAGLLPFCFLTLTTPFWLMIAALSLVGLGFALFSSPNSNAVMSSVDRQHYGTAAGTLGTMRAIGQTVSMGTIALIFSLRGIQGERIGPDSMPAFVASARTSFVIFTALCTLGVLASLTRGRLRTGVSPDANGGKDARS